MTVAHTKNELTEASIELLTKQRREAARWLALEVLITDDYVTEDEELANRLIALQDRLTDTMRKAAKL